MKSSEETAEYIQTDSQDLLTIQHPLYALLAVYIPLSIFAGILPSLNYLASRFISPAPVLLWFCSGLLSGTIASIYWAIIKRSKADHTAANIRGGILVVIVIYVFGSLIRSGLPLGRRFIPSFTNFFPGLFSVTIWFTVLSVKRIFEGQELIASYTRNYDGEKLRQIMLQDSGIMSEADTDTRKLITRYRVFFLLPFVLIIACGILGMPLSAIFAAALALLFLAGVSIIAFLGFLRREYAYAAEGLVFTSRPKALLAGIIVIFASAVLGLLLSSGKSILSFDIILNLLRRLLAYLEGLFTGKPVEMPARSEEALMPQMPGLPPELAAMIGEAKPSHFWDYVQYAAIGLVVFLFISFMINPLLNRSKLFRGAGTWPKKIAAFLKVWFRALASGLKGFLSSLRESAGGRTLPDSAILRGIEENILEGYSAAKKRDMRRSAGLFARLIYWGTEILRINWKPSHAPIEYCGLLVEAVNGEDGANNDELIHGITRSGALFDKALYSAEPLSRPERDEFKALV
jgi:hypothetical protein